MPRFSIWLIVLIVCLLRASIAIPTRSGFALHSRALQLRGGGQRHLKDPSPKKCVKQVNETGVFGNDTSGSEINGSVKNSTSACSIRREPVTCTMLPGACRRAQQAQKAGPPGRTSFKRTFSHFVWAVSDWVGITGTSTRIVSECACLFFNSTS
jgi:hypothetical protein